MPWYPAAEVIDSAFQISVIMQPEEKLSRPSGLVDIPNCLIIVLGKISEQYLGKLEALPDVNIREFDPANIQRQVWEDPDIVSIVNNSELKQTLIIGDHITRDMIALSSLSLSKGFDTFAVAQEVEGMETAQVLRLFFMGVVFLSLENLLDEVLS